MNDIEADLLIAKTENQQLKKENAALRNELCLKCGLYTNAHNGACNGCRWKNENTR